MNLVSRLGKITLSDLTFAVYCLYFAMFYLCYITFVPDALSTLFLAAFLAASVLIVILSGRIAICGYELRYLFFSFCILISFLVNGLQADSFDALKGIIVCVMLSFFSARLIIKEKSIKSFLKVVVVAALVAMVWMYLTGQLTDFDRLDTEFTDSINAVAMVYLLPFSGAVYLWASENKRINKLFYIGSAALLLIFIAYTGSRTASIAALVFVAVFSLTSGKKEEQLRFLKRVFVLIAIAVVFYILVWKIPLLYNALGSRIEGLMSSVSGDGNGDFSATRRLDIIRIGWENFLKRPIFGYGIDGFKRATGFSFYAHNTYIEILCDYGLVGFFAYYSIAGVALIRLFKAIRKNNTTLLRWLFAAIFMILISEIGTVAYNIWSSQIYVALSFIILNPRFKESELE